MHNLKELMKNMGNLKYGKKRKKEINRDVANAIGHEKYLVICMEEIGELIDVVSLNVYDNVDYIHTAEELADVLVCIDAMKTMNRIKDKDLDKVCKKQKKKVSIFECISNLAKSQQAISKNIRGKDNGSKFIPTINLLNETIENLIFIYKIKKKDIEKIEALKYKRLEDRIKNKTIG